jgi:electron transfer flavoprotein beta subunit
MAPPLRIAVAVKQVPSGQGGATDPRKGFVLRTGPGRLNPFDGPALEMALRLKDGHGALVDLFSMGPPQAEKTLKEALSLGADQAFHLCDPLLSGSDSLATARALVRAMGLEGPYDLVACGLASTDGGTGQVGPAMASLMGRPFVGRLEMVLGLEGRTLSVSQLYEDERIESRVPLPAVVAVLRENHTPRLPTVRARLRPRLITRLTVADLAGPGDDGDWAAPLFGEQGSPTRILRTRRPKPPDKVLARPSPAEAAAAILEAALAAKA